MKKFGIEPRAYANVREYGDNELDPNIIPLRLNSALSQSELLHLLPKMSGTQIGLLYNAANDISKVKFNELLLNLEMEENNAKFTLMNNK